jgi:hypothetical protein
MKLVFPLLALLVLPLGTIQAADTVDFQRDIRPILSDFCFKCHGPDTGTIKGKLRLDLRDAALKGGSSGEPSIVVGKPDLSEMIRRMVTTERSEVMPPPSTGKKLTEAQITLFKKWIAQGADYQTHWAYVPPKRPAVPTLKDDSAVKNLLDRFVQAKLAKEGLAPSPLASKETQIRRLSLDLLGLPPRLDEIDTFVNDTRPGAYERLVERLLSSPAYGERWGRHWLDAARYADSDGYEKDKPRLVWMYRDWVVDALNRDLPYDQFVIEQIAGDLLPGATQEQIVATGFLRNSMINEEGGIDPEQFRMEAMFDRMDAVGKSVLGLTLSCAQCHSHKYDPISHEDYFKIFAYLNDTHEASLIAYTLPQQKKRGEIFGKIRTIEDKLRMKSQDWPKILAAWETAVRNDQPAWKIVAAKNAGDNAQRYVENEDGSLTAGGYAPTKWSAPFRATLPAGKISAIRLEMLTDPELPLNGPGRSPVGLFALSEFKVDIGGKAVKFVSATADFGNEEKPLEARYDDLTKAKRTTGPISFAIDGKNETAWGIDAGHGRRNVDRKAVFVLEKPIEVKEGTEIRFNLVQMHGGWNSDDNQNNNLGRFRFATTDAENAKADPLPRRIREYINIPQDRRTEAQNQAVFSYWRSVNPEWKEENAEIEALWKQHPEGAAQLAFKARDKKRMTYLLDRGDFLKPVREIKPGVPAALHPMPAGAGEGRLAFAKWLVDRNSPTTARAMVNRVWQAYFGTGLVITSEDLGVQSEAPVHRELLDWLAVEFMDSGWSLKHLHRLIVTSHTYRQSSKSTPELLRRDPDNRLVARASRFRVEGEVVRDVALAASGLLTLRTGGAPVHPPAPGFLFVPPVSYGSKVWQEDTGEERYRRALYTFRFRSVPYPVLTNFDTPNGDASCVRRVRSNTPLQALTTLNETLFLETARGLARLTLNEGGKDDRERLIFAFRRCTGRTPDSRELGVLEKFLEKQVQRFSTSDARPWELAADDPAKPPKLPTGESASRAAAWTALSRLLLNLDETITRE